MRCQPAMYPPESSQIKGMRSPQSRVEINSSTLQRVNSACARMRARSLALACASGSGLVEGLAALLFGLGKADEWVEVELVASCGRGSVKSCQVKARQGKARQGKARPSQASQDKTRQDKSRRQLIILPRQA